MKNRLLYDRPVPYQRFRPDSEEIWNEAAPHWQREHGCYGFWRSSDR